MLYGGKITTEQGRWGDTDREDRGMNGNGKENEGNRSYGGNFNEVGKDLWPFNFLRI